MASWTSSPNNIQFPGGVVEPPADGADISVEFLQNHAAIELWEETGVRVQAGALEALSAYQVSNGNLGFFFKAPRLNETLLSVHRPTTPASLTATESHLQEFDRLFLLTARQIGDLAAQKRCPEYLDALVREYGTP
ncbi:hypothetical protein ACIQTX_17960 [Microbacterium sp. NPDC090281]|uniref:hypothetical protein n=1 Tax=Microbacterium sp. NPDC090281 TaxID=3364208 RepID=UPI00380E150D